MNAKLKYELENPFYPWLLAVIIVCAAISALFSSCSTTKHIDRQAVTTHQAASDSGRKVEEATRTIQRTTKEEYEAPATIPGTEAQGSIPLPDLMGGKPLVTEDENQRTEATYNNKTGEVNVKTKLKPRTVPVKGKREVNEVIQEVVKKDSAGRSQKVSDTSQVTEKRDVKRTNLAPVVLVAVPILLLLAVYFIWKYRNRIPILKNFFV